VTVEEINYEMENKTTLGKHSLKNLVDRQEGYS